MADINYRADDYIGELPDWLKGQAFDDLDHLVVPNGDFDLDEELFTWYGGNDDPPHNYKGLSKVTGIPDALLDAPFGQGPVLPQDEINPDVAAFRQAFDDSDVHLLEPLDLSFNYSFSMVKADANTLELSANKWWIDQEGAVCKNSLPLNTYDIPEAEAERAAIAEEAAMEWENLRHTHEKEGLEAAMQLAEQMAVQNGYLDPDRDDPRLFTEGPKDQFQTLREADLLAQQPALSREADSGPSLDF